VPVLRELSGARIQSLSDPGLMRFLADEKFPRPTLESLRKEGHDVVWVRTDCPGLADRRLIERAEADNRLILTLDKDFWQLALRRPDGLQHSGVILFRTHPAVPENLQPLVVVMLRAEREWIGHVSIVTKDGIELIPTRGRRA
jgi:predicted nuclease of predicted toxin-antitoxin system